MTAFVPAEKYTNEGSLEVKLPTIWTDEKQRWAEAEGGSKSRLAKAAGAEPSGQMRDEQMHAIVVRSTFVSEKAKNTSRSDHFWKLRCRKSARLFWREARFEVKMYKTHDHFWTFRSRFAWQA